MFGGLRPPSPRLCIFWGTTTRPLLLRSAAREYKETVGRQVVVALYVLAMVVIIVGVDVLVLRHQFWPRLAVNIAVVLVFIGGYFWLVKPRVGG